MPRPSLAFIPLVFATTCLAQLSPAGATASFRGSLPPPPVAALSPDQESILQDELDAVTESFAAVRQHERAADVEIFLKAVRYALEFDEWYDKKPEDGLKKGRELLAEAARRIESLKKNETPWLNGPGQKVLGFYSDIDDSPQPYGVEAPEGLEWGSGKKPVPMWVWLHGRGDTQTDLHFVYSRLTAKKPGQFQPKGTIVIHPFGRYCNGYKSAGETDVFEARDDAIKRFNVDRDRIALAGFSMGGAGAWHIGAHYADQWACVHAGAGFVDVKRYQKLTPEKMPPWYEQTLWGVYDVPDCARNFFNVPLIVYSGENDAQRDAAEYMSEVLARQGCTMKHLIGPGMGHKYHPEVIKEVQRLIEDAVAKGRDPMPKKVVLQFRSARYARLAWIEVIECDKPWEDTQAEAELTDATIKLTTRNVRALRLNLDIIGRQRRQIVIDGQTIPKTPDNISTPGDEGLLVNRFGGWQLSTASRAEGKSKHAAKAGGTSMEDCLRRRFVVVLPDRPGRSPHVDAWVKAESEHFIRRWRSLMRGDPIIKKASDIKPNADLHESLVLWGDDRSNSLIAWQSSRLPVKWTDDAITIGGRSFPNATHVPVLGYPSFPEFAQTPPSAGCVLLNSGLTFREAHDRTNSLQNPKLPDWAIIDITQPPNAESPGKVVAADFFDERWQVKK